MVIYRQAKDSMDRAINFMQNFDPDTQVEQALARKNALESNYKKFCQASLNLESLEEEENTGTDFAKDMAAFEEDYFTLKAFYASLEVPRTPAPLSGSSGNSFRALKLPDIKLPEFSGSILRWFSYYDTFDSLVHNNAELSDVQKFHYLKSTLRGEALKLVEKMSVTGNNYSVALKMLTDRYQNLNILVRSHIEALFKVEKVRKECPRELTSLVGDFENNLGVLEKLGENTKGWSSLLVHMVSSRLDHNTLREWQRAADKKKMPTYEELINFIREYVMELETLQSDRPVRDSRPNLQSVNAATDVKSNDNCAACGKGHRLYFCEQFKNMPVTQRAAIVKKSGLCVNCLFGKHSFATCKYGACRVCGTKHHTLLHNPDVDKARGSGTNQVPKQPSVSNFAGVDSSLPVPVPLSLSANTHSGTKRLDLSPSNQVFLATAVVKVLGPKGTSFLARVLLDSASQPNLMTERFRRLLNSRKTPGNTEIAGIGGNISAVSLFSTVATVASRFNNFRVPLEFIVMDKVTSDLPTCTIDVHDWAIPENIRLADPSFATRGPIDMVIGARVFFELLRSGHSKLGDGKPMLQNSVFGWLVSGFHDSGSNADEVRVHCNLSTFHDLEQSVSRFWELEMCQTNSTLSVEERLCENHFESTTRRDDSGRYIVSLPKKPELIGQLGNSRAIATRRFYCLEKRLEQNSDLKAQYSSFMSEYLALGHMKLVDAVEDVPGRHFYLPHHAVFKPDSSSTKLRVVFDGSCKTTSGFSLNDLLLKGPTVQDDMISIILRFRMHPVVVTADVTKMYRQIWVAEEDRAYQRILWRESSSEPLRTYELTTVTYGTTTAPYLATRCLQQIADDEAQNFPKAVPVVKQGFYVDDVMRGFDTVEEAVTAIRETSLMLNSCGFPLCKYASNVPEVVEQFPAELREQASVLELDRSSPIKALGLFWKLTSDELLFKVPEWPDVPSTKRNILSYICSLFDPLGLVGPVIVRAKMLIQLLWEMQLGWDDPVPTSTSDQWMEISSQLPILSQLSIPRFVLTEKLATLELHGFADASLRAYGACIYLRSISASGAVTVRLMTAKSRVAPTEKRRPTLARLELCASLRLANLQNQLLESLQLQCPRFLWSDSTITLHWISRDPSNWNSFVANRVSQIQQLTENATWLHVPTEDNPADHISRGLTPESIVGNELWWNGPKWLLRPPQHWPASAYSWKTQPPPEVDTEKRKAVPISAVCTHQESWTRETLGYFDSYYRLLRIIALCKRFMNNCKLLEHARTVGFLAPSEIRSAELSLLQCVQLEEFAEDHKRLRQGSTVSQKSPLLKLRPFMDQNEQLIRVGGRLKNAPIPFDRKYPFLIPKKHFITDLIFIDAHEETLHAGPSHLLAAVRRRYWPIDGPNKARNTVHQCIVCFRNKPRFAQQVMAHLPAVRVTPSLPFTSTGVDFMGPVYLKPPRKQGPIKSYICVFVCMVTKAAHLELVMSLTSDAFIAALKRFCSRRRRPSDIYCDNATNFVGAKNQLEELRVLFLSQRHQSEIARTTARMGIAFHFIPPRSPTFGGLWEACVKSVKHHLHRVTLDVLQTQEEMTTTVAQIEACLNSRPLTPRSNDPTDLEALTPGHFLIGGPILALPEPNLTSLPSNHLSRWQDQQRVLQTLWDRWYVEYLPTLQRLQKWPGKHPNLAVGDMVLVEDNNLPPTKWPIARVLKTIVGDDACGRVADVLCDGNQIHRCSIRKMCPLPHCEASTVTESERQPSAPSCTPQPSPTIDLQAPSTLPAAAQLLAPNSEIGSDDDNDE
ncbi:uncharacterized protein LOC129758753 [Uranotaenia lowii]|uniref:uncharacterized protein LOC129758753 n=1 Tax=Uranotaenia lowii TaxID=190385 RepID=UPI002479A1E6|nr:uncharacterized protein LOC129758753 [Uranotaenia lowii]